MSHRKKMSEDEGFSQMIGWSWLLLDYNDINMATFSSKHSLVTDRQTDRQTERQTHNDSNTRAKERDISKNKVQIAH